MREHEAIFASSMEHACAYGALSEEETTPYPHMMRNRDAEQMDQPIRLGCDTDEGDV
jgi:hypothetical protein